VSKTFEEKFGKSPDRMDEGEWKQAQFSLFSEIFDRLDITNGSVKQTYKNTSKINLMWVIGGIYGTIIGGSLIWLVFSYLKHSGIP
jgi:hypothetical protein